MGEVLAGRYELVTIVGRGSMGEVWRARDTVLQRDVAIKVIAGARRADPVAFQRFQREALAMANLFHPNIVSVYDAGSDGDRSFLVMELLTGPSVARLIADEGRLAVDRVVRMGAQVARGLSAAHTIGITHRDIKPGNVLKHNQVTKIVDFGIARLEHVGETLTSPAMAIGTAAYMSPEQARGKPVQAPSDVYSLACLMTAMLTGRPPFTDPDPIEVARSHAMDQPPRITSARHDVPADLADLLDQMLLKRPTERPTAAAVAVELAAIESRLLGLQLPGSPFSPLAPSLDAQMPTVRRDRVLRPGGVAPGGASAARADAPPLPRHQPTPVDPIMRPKRRWWKRRQP